MNSLTYFGADGFNCDAYGQHAFGECATSTDGGLSYTGEMVILPLALGAAIIVASAILLIKKIRRNKKSRTNSKIK